MRDVPNGIGAVLRQASELRYDCGGMCVLTFWRWFYLILGFTALTSIAHFGLLANSMRSADQAPCGSIPGPHCSVAVIRLHDYSGPEPAGFRGKGIEGPLGQFELSSLSETALVDNRVTGRFSLNSPMWTHQEQTRVMRASAPRGLVTWSTVCGSRKARVWPLTLAQKPPACRIFFFEATLSCSKCWGGMGPRFLECHWPCWPVSLSTFPLRICFFFLAISEVYGACQYQAWPGINHV